MFVSFAWAAPQYAVVAINQTLSRGPSGPGVGFVVKPVPVEVIGPEEGGWRVRTVADTSHCYPPMISGLSLDLWVPEGAFATVLSAPVQRSSEGGTVTFAAGHIVGAPGDDGWVAIDGRSLRARLSPPPASVGARYAAEGLPRSVPVANTSLRASELLSGEGLKVVSVAREPLAIWSDGKLVRVQDGCVALALPGKRATLGELHHASALEWMEAVPTLEPPVALRWPDGSAAGSLTVPVSRTHMADALGCWRAETTASRVDVDGIRVCGDVAPDAVEGARQVHWREVQSRLWVDPRHPMVPGAPVRVECRVSITVDTYGRPVGVEALSCEEAYLAAVTEAVMASRWSPYQGERGPEPVRFEMKFSFTRM